MNKRPFLWFTLAILFGVGLFLTLSWSRIGLGFPLDDAWIHQTYARNFAENGRWEFVPGVVSSGSTAPLWTLLLAVGYWLRLPYLLWAYLLGALCLLGTAYAGSRLWQQVWPTHEKQVWLIGLVTIFTWPLLWAAVSGMETLLFMMLGLFTLTVYFDTLNSAATAQAASAQSASPRWPWFQLGILSGLLMLTRPDGIVVIIVVLLGTVLIAKSMQQRTAVFLRQILGLFFGIGLLLLPYFAFNWWSSGHIWPTTLYAKQAEYAVLLAQPLPQRLARLAAVSFGSTEMGGMASPHLLLLPGILFAIGRLLYQRAWPRLLPLLWAIGHLVLYAWRLPLVYQHGRYLLPTIPIWLLYGLAGWLWLFTWLARQHQAAALLRRVLTLSYVVVTAFFLLLGAAAYADDVNFIEGEMVTTARWLAENTSEDALIATHDIGAIGYFAKRPLLDLAGLLSPSVVPFLTDQTAMVDYAVAQEADYLVTAPGWPYVAVEKVGTAVYTTNYAPSTSDGYNNMTVYELDNP